jgi:hypothetical protein
MATRSTIAIELQDGTIAQIYCHFDGYIEHNGSILEKHYQDQNKIHMLISLGNLSILGSEIGKKQDFKNPTRGWCLAYGRDRGEQTVKARHFDSFVQYTLCAVFEEYNYIFRDGHWLVAREDLKFRPLTAALDKLAVEILK